MKREFLQNLKVGEEALPKEVIDTIMEENGRDITAAKTAAVKPYARFAMSTLYYNRYAAFFRNSKGQTPTLRLKQSEK